MNEENVVYTYMQPVSHQLRSFVFKVVEFSCLPPKLLQKEILSTMKNQDEKGCDHITNPVVRGNFYLLFFLFVVCI